MHKPNMLLESDVQEELDWDPQIDDTRITIKADSGNVTLSGSVPSYYQATRAADDVTVVGGVTGIDNQLLVGLLGETMNDADIAVASAGALDADKFVPKGAVSADVLNGYVTLTGTVRHHFERQAATHAVSRVDGVLGIDDSISLSSDPIPSDVADRIKKAFKRNAIIDDSMIEVSNDGHTIELDGVVSTWNARQAAEDTAWDAPGVTNVVNMLTVVP
jgi:osmotically-inducible protein OsmY